MGINSLSINISDSETYTFNCANKRKYIEEEKEYCRAELKTFDAASEEQKETARALVLRKRLEFAKLMGKI